MKRKKIKKLSTLLIGMLTLTTSCVQGDLYELYEDSEGLYLTRNKKGKDIGIYPKDLIAARGFVESESFNPNDNECLAASLYYYCLRNGILSYNTPYKIREKIGITVYDNNPEWPIYYRNAVCFGGGIYSDVSQIINEVAGISYHGVSKTGSINGTMICGFNNNHLALVWAVKPLPSGLVDWYVQDQTGYHYMSARAVDSYYY